MPPLANAAPLAADRSSARLLPWLLVAALLAGYANTFSGPFVFDDIAAVTQNPSIEHLATALNPPAGLSVTGRPLVNLTLALNFAISGRGPWSYHALNLALHAASALALFGLLRRALHSLNAQPSTLNGNAVALATASLWSLHPLHTSAVTYVMQRTELLASLCYLLTLYAFARATQCHLIGDIRPSPASSTRSRWLALAGVACGLGMAAKEIMVTAPLAVLLYDRAFAAGSFRAALRTRPLFYAALAGTWLLLGALLLGTDSRGASAGFGAGMAWTDYAVSQLFAILHYLRLALWPCPLVFDYGDRIVPLTGVAATGVAVLIAIAGASVVALVRWPRLGFCGAFFFLLMAPSSSVVPVATQTMAEHRVYLALAAPIVVVAIALHRLCGRRVLPWAAALALALGATTFARNQVFSSEISLWRDTVAKAPANARAHFNYGVLLALAGDRDAAQREYSAALLLDPHHAAAHQKLGTLLLDLHQPADALPHLEAAAALLPDSAAVHYDLGNALVQLQRVAEAADHYAAAVRLAPAHAAARYNFGNSLTQLGRYREALVQFDEAARLDPADASARNNAARIRAYLGESPR